MSHLLPAPPKFNRKGVNAGLGHPQLLCTIIAIILRTIIVGGEIKYCNNCVTTEKYCTQFHYLWYLPIFLKICLKI